MFPSSFSIAALIGAAAIRERVVTNLRLNTQKEGEDNLRDKRKLSAELNIDNDDDNVFDNDVMKKPKTEDDTNSLVTPPKILNENPIFDQIKLANCFLRDQSLIKAKRDWDSEENKQLEIEKKSRQNFAPNISLSTAHSTSTNDFNQKNSLGKHTVNSNTKLLEKVTPTLSNRIHLSF